MEVAAWVQAIGSILAILAGFAFVSFQRWQEKRSRVQTLVGLVEAVLMLLTSHKNTSTRLTSCFEYSVVWRRASSDLKAMREVIFSVDLSAIDSGRLWVAFSAFVAGLDQIIATLDSQADELSGEDMEQQVSQSSISNVDDRLRFMAEVAKRLTNTAKEQYGVRTTHAARVDKLFDSLGHSQTASQT